MTIRPVPKPERKKKEKPIKPVKVVKEKCPLEESEQMALCEWLDWNKILYQASQVGAYLHPSTYNRMKKMGVKPGFPDIMIYDRPGMVENGYVHVGTAIELKRMEGGVVSLDQKVWLDMLVSRGWKAQVCKGADSAIEWLKSIGYGRKE